MQPVFKVVRKGPRGRDSHKHTFGVVAVGNPESVRLGYSGKEAMINGLVSSDGAGARRAVELLCAALNAQFEKYLRGEFHKI